MRAPAHRMKCPCYHDGLDFADDRASREHSKLWRGIVSQSPRIRLSSYDRDGTISSACHHKRCSSVTTTRSLLSSSRGSLAHAARVMAAVGLSMACVPQTSRRHASATMSRRPLREECDSVRRDNSVKKWSKWLRLMSNYQIGLISIATVRILMETRTNTMV